MAQTIQMSFARALKVVDTISSLDNPYPVMFRGAHGIGKSEIFEQLAKKKGIKYIDVYASQLTEGDLLGIPHLLKMTMDNGEIVLHGEDENVESFDYTTEFGLPLWILEASKKPCLLCFEEIDRADPQVRKSFMQLACFRRLWGIKLHPKTVIAAAINGGPVCGDNYDVGQMDPAELDRWCVIDVVPTVQDWYDWAEREDKDGNKNIHPDILTFVKDSPNFLESKGSVELDYVSPSRRSWKRFNDVLVTSGLLEDIKSMDRGTERSELLLTIKDIAASILGFEASMAFGRYAENLKIVRFEDFFKKDSYLLWSNGLDVSEASNALESMFNSDEKFQIFNGITDGKIYNFVKFILNGPGENTRLFQSKINKKILTSNLENKSRLIGRLHNMEVEVYNGDDVVLESLASRLASVSTSF